MSQQRKMKFDPCYGYKRASPFIASEYRLFHGKKAWLFNPWTGKRRKPEDIGRDVFGLLIHTVYGDLIHTSSTDHPAVDLQAQLEASNQEVERLKPLAAAFDLLMDRLDGREQLLRTYQKAVESPPTFRLSDPTAGPVATGVRVETIPVYEWRIRLERHSNLRQALLAEAATLAASKEQPQ